MLDIMWVPAWQVVRRGMQRKGEFDTPAAWPLLLIDTCGQPAREHGIESKANLAESKIAWSHAKVLLRMRVPPEEIGIITPYQMQVNLPGIMEGSVLKPCICMLGRASSVSP
jgi:hypothetical protein